MKASKKFGAWLDRLFAQSCRSAVIILFCCLIPLVAFINRPAVLLRICEDPFYVRIPGTRDTPHIKSNWPCYVAAPKLYKPPLSPAERLWRVPRSAIGELDETESDYVLHWNRQRWATKSEEFVYIRPEGGTSGRAFKDNFDYVQKLWNGTRRTKRCGEYTNPLMLDMGAGIGSVAAAMKDSRGLNGKIQVLSYVMPDKYMRSQVIMTHRGLPAFLANFTGRLPFPKQGFDIVHCKWCWHHQVGYDKWLKEVDRLLVPGGYFVFTLSKGGDGIIDEESWDAAIARRPFKCEKHDGIILFCRKDMAPDMSEETGDFCPAKKEKDTLKDIKRRKTAESKVAVMKKTLDAESARILNVNCPDAEMCSYLDDSFDSVLHISQDKASRTVDQLVGMKRRMAMVHNFRENFPVYPRSFDIVNLGCSSQTKGVLNKREFWVELHRVLVPGGMVVLMRSFCIWRNLNVIRQAAFDVRSVSRDLVVVSRKSYLKPS